MIKNFQFNERSAEIGKAIANATATALKLEPSEADTTFDALQTSMLCGASYDESEALEIKRRIAEAKVSIFSTMLNAQQEFLVAWRNLESLGYSDHEREATMVFYQARHLIRIKGDKAAAARAVVRLGEVVEHLRDAGSKDLQAHFQGVHDRLLDELQQK